MNHCYSSGRGDTEQRAYWKVRFKIITITRHKSFILNTYSPLLTEIERKVSGLLQSKICTKYQTGRPENKGQKEYKFQNISFSKNLKQCKCFQSKLLLITENKIKVSEIWEVSLRFRARKSIGENKNKIFNLVSNETFSSKSERNALSSLGVWEQPEAAHLRRRVRKSLCTAVTFPFRGSSRASYTTAIIYCHYHENSDQGPNPLRAAHRAAPVPKNIKRMKIQWTSQLPGASRAEVEVETREHTKGQVGRGRLLPYCPQHLELRVKH